MVGLSQGGNACGASYAWVHTTPPDDLRVSEAFGTCNELVGVSHDAETVRVRLKGGEPGKGGDVTFLYDGRTVTRRQEALHPSGGQGNQGGADYWVGRYAFELLHAAELQVPLRAIMGDDALLALQSTVRMTSPMRIEGDWVIGEGGYVKYQPPLTDNGFVAMNRTDGRLVVGLRRNGGAPELFGDLRGPPLTGTMKDWIGR